MTAPRQTDAHDRRVLVVDDDPDMLHIIRGVLQDEGFSVATAGDGGLALSVARREPPDLAVLDYTLPMLDSRQLAARLRELRGAALPVLVITADGQAADKARRLGAYAYLRKPFELGELLAAVRRGFGAD